MEVMEYQEMHTPKQENGRSQRYHESRMRKEGHELPEKWTNGTIVYIYKNKGGPGDCENYMPICLTQIIYEIWEGLITRTLIKIAHILSRNIQFGYKEGISTIGAIIKIGQYIERANRDADILMMGRPKAFGAINKTLLWTTLYKKGIPVEMIIRIRRGHQRTKLAPKYKWGYGGLSWSNIGRCISTIGHYRATSHNLHGRNDGWQRRNEPQTKSPNQDSASRPHGERKPDTPGNSHIDSLKKRTTTRTTYHRNNKKICRTKKNWRKTTQHDICAEKTQKSTKQKFTGEENENGQRK